MKRLAPILFLLSASTALSATVDSGLQDGDSIRLGYTTVITVPRNYSSGGAGVFVFGRKAALGSAASETLTALIDYKLMIKHVDEDKLAKLELKGASPATYLHNESFSTEITGQELNLALAKARTECADCTSFYLAVSQDTGWGSFDLLPIRDYKGAHSLNRQPSAMRKKAPDGQLDGFTVFNSYIDYLPASH